MPSASINQQPWASVMKRGVPPTAVNARTGEFTPPGMTLHAASNSCADVRAAPLTREVACSVLPMTTSVPACPGRSTTGCKSLPQPPEVCLMPRPVHELDGGHATTAVAGSVQSICHQPHSAAMGRLAPGVRDS
ncbi:Uncharacterised protein [Mycobacterium tuberculosis]|nr:Uncharacterised protein [Mycobacterium tuberculosis]